MDYKTRQTRKNEQMVLHLLNDLTKEVAVIREQTMRTNGRVSTLENWRSYITGGVAVLLVLFVPVFLRAVGSWLVP